MEEEDSVSLAQSFFRSRLESPYDYFGGLSRVYDKGVDVQGVQGNV